MEANRGKTLCEQCSYVTKSQVVPEISPASPPRSQERKLKWCPQKLTPQHFNWNSGTQENVTTQFCELMCQTMLLCYGSCRKQVYMEQKEILPPRKSCSDDTFCSRWPPEHWARRSKLDTKAHSLYDPIYMKYWAQVNQQNMQQTWAAMSYVVERMELN